MAKAKEGVGSVTGSKATAAWLAGAASRHAADAATAREALEKMAFPPWGSRSGGSVDAVMDAAVPP
jgi:hypothetical protein